ncbi:hypothetical protein [Pelagibius sp. Alg239-R121]|uniref:hypothetical protein n=1 Tax=Pelagibius sp. Alg239-R121 TaxID=2993448 RepID=UPI0024A652DC|nr:hypothetical protein [Pelagibius sp. Alg239-R121]
MTHETAGFDLSAANVRAIDTSKLKKINIAEASNETFQHFVEIQQKFLELRFSSGADTSQHPGYNSYATVTLNGKVVARLDNNGFVKTSNDLGSRLHGELPGDVNGKTGPVLAEARAEKIAELLGGKVERSASALSQSQYEGLAKPQSNIDYAAMKADPAYEQLQKTKQARSAFLAQQMAQSEQPTPEESTAEKSTASDAVQDFLDYMSKSPEERYFEAFLKEKGLTPEQFANLPSEEKEKIMEAFEQRMEQQAMISAAESMTAAAATKAAAIATTQTATASSRREQDERTR